MKKVISVSLGSPKGDKVVHVKLLGEDFEISRIGTNGNTKMFAQLVQELDGNVDAIGLGGIDLHLYAKNGKRYTISDAAKLASIAKTTPVVDGSGIKNTLERETIRWLQREGVIDFSEKNVLVVCGVDRFGMAEEISRVTKSVVFGDLMFNVGLPIPINSYRSLDIIARILLPLVCILPFQWLYPTGEKQEKITPRFEKYFHWADVIAGDYKIIGRYMPPPESNALRDKVIITNTLTSEDINNLRIRGVRLLITPTLQFDNRVFATNVLEGIIITLAGKHPEDMLPQDYMDILFKMNWQPTVTRLQDGNTP